MTGASVAVLVGVLVAVATLEAQTKVTFSQANGSIISAVDSNARTVTVTHMQPLGACSPTTGCPQGRSPDALREGEVMALNTLDQVENDFTKMKVGDLVTVYFKSSGAASIPYAVKDLTLVPPGCDPVTKICSGSFGEGTPTPGGTGGSQPPDVTVTPIPVPAPGDTGGGSKPPTLGCTRDAKLCPDGSYVYRTGPNCAFAVCPGGFSGSSGRPSVGQCVQIQTFPVQTICSANIENDLSLGVQNGEVITLQTKLQSLGYFPGTLQPTGYFGPVTKKAVTDFQFAQGLPATGYVGPLTRSALEQ